MADHSYFEFSCPCGKQYRREQQETFYCECGRLLVLDWSGGAESCQRQAEESTAEPTPRLSEQGRKHEPTAEV